ncbi:ornithine carbamoyltransferase [Variovorax sp. GB1R11]|uniref:ornithine carbamoyltransferase n=1 Tax=Variovorax sp. GB1R11 TaxID=3443741 RepID=UPI003F45FA0B
MLLPSEPTDLRTSNVPPPQDTAELLRLALRLRHLARTNALPLLLRGMNIGLLRAAAVVDDPAPLLRAAGELGAHVATVRWNLSGAGNPREVQHTGRTLGRLYDAVVCQGMPAALVRQIGQAAGIPVYDDIACDAHPSARLADGLGEEAAPGDNRRFMLQALLVEGLT